MTKNTDFEGILPERVYKYRIWSDPYHKKILTHDQLFFSKQEKLNDPFDALFPFHYHEDQMTEENVKLKLEQTIMNLKPNISRADLNILVSKRMEEVNFHNSDYWIEAIPTFKKMVNENIGICSLASQYNNHGLWTHYGNCHKGFCLGFDSNNLYNSTGGLMGNVIYSDNENIVDLFDEGPNGLIVALMLKSPQLNFESEIRIAKVGMAGKPHLYKNDCLKEVILGTHISDYDKDQIIAAIKSYHPTIEVYQLKMEYSSKKLVKERIDL
ncbi:DUF2971 domain-containing protein [Algoriphagus halophilus]|uniref:DUF2971 domain-containing protein n=1 Tax=Algoriphagus halophilus TaxID=226505 RepID=UPI00358F7647